MRPRFTLPRLLLSLLAWAWILTPVLWPASASPLIVQADLGGWTINAIWSVVSALYGIFRGSTSLGVKLAFNDLRIGVLDLAKDFFGFVGDIRSWLPALLGLLRRLKDNVLRPLISWLSERIRWLRDWLKRIFAPVFRVLWKIRAELLQFYTKYIRPILDVIEAVRFVLGTLSRLGVKWAAELDRRLAQIESAITVNFQKILGAVNRVINTVDSIVTLELLFQRVPFLRTLRRDVLYVSRILVNSRTATRLAPRTPKVPTIDQIKANTEQALLTGGGPYGPFISEMAAIWRQYLDVR